MQNHEQFVLLAGTPEAWDEELRERVQRGEEIGAVQVDQYMRGRRSATLVRVVVPRVGWVVRGASNLQTGTEHFITPNNGRYTKEDALRKGKEWAAADPNNREFFVRRSDLRGVESYE
jgi:hypothetical protein